MHHELFFKVFKAGYSAADIHGMMPRLMGFIDRRIPIFYPTTLRDITQRSMRKFFTDEWKPGAEEDVRTLFKAYVTAGYISLADTNFSRTGDGPNTKECGTVLQQAIEYKHTWSSSIITALLEAGADLDNVPMTDQPGVICRVFGETSVTDVSKGDILGFTAAVHGSASLIGDLVKEALMTRAVASIQAGRAALVPTGSNSADTPARSRRIGL
ncbi:hypothetical protein [Hydrogenophaga sp. 2FB]|uniref:hypothetical protein n=1 Tax=Hydrogenophaga sp. 2FB TaxID=2502187 RepID=UPI0010F95A4F|nr:hypothetical protein [Hydrogenophaga sp. 2FB]